MTAVPVIADQARGFEPVDVGHVDVEEDHRELGVQDALERLGARARDVDVGVNVFQEAAVHEQLLRQVIDDQNPGPGH